MYLSCDGCSDVVPGLQPVVTLTKINYAARLGQSLLATDGCKLLKIVLHDWRGGGWRQTSEGIASLV